MDIQLQLRLARASPENATEWRTLLCTPPHGWCWCVAWETPGWEGWTDRTEEQNRACREEMWQRGEFNAYLLYANEKPAAWCKVGPRKTWPKLCAQYKLEPGDSTYTFACFGILDEYRRRGLMHELMARALDDLRSRGVAQAEGFPRKINGEAEPGELWMGPEKLFVKAGFRKMESYERANRYVIDL